MLVKRISAMEQGARIAKGEAAAAAAVRQTAGRRGGTQGPRSTYLIFSRISAILYALGPSAAHTWAAGCPLVALGLGAIQHCPPPVLCNVEARKFGLGYLEEVACYLRLRPLRAFLSRERCGWLRDKSSRKPLCKLQKRVSAAVRAR
jgi:hypothetical protein